MEKMIMPIVSVIVPNYNHERYLRQRIDSILCQKYQDFELILLDDCSTDNSRDVLLSYKDNPKVASVIFNSENSGSTFKQWQKGIELAKGEYIWIAESDDFALPDFLTTCMDALNRNPKCTVAFTGSKMVNELGEAIENMDWDNHLPQSNLFDVFDGADFVKHHLLWTNEIYNASMTVFKKECYWEVGSAFMSFKYCGDWLFWTEVARQGQVVRCNQKLNCFRQHECKVSPDAEKNGLYYSEGIYVMKNSAKMLKLSKMQCRVLGGRLVKRIRGSKSLDNSLRRKFLKNMEEQFGKQSYLNVVLYELNKYFNILGLQK